MLGSVRTIVEAVRGGSLFQGNNVKEWGNAEIPRYSNDIVSDCLLGILILLGFGHLILFRVESFDCC